MKILSLLFCSLLMVLPGSVKAMDAMDLDEIRYSIPTLNDVGVLVYNQVAEADATQEVLYPAYVQPENIVHCLYRCALLAGSNADSYPKIRAIVDGFMNLVKTKIQSIGAYIQENFRDAHLSMNYQRALALLTQSLRVDPLTGELFKRVPQWEASPYKTVAIMSFIVHWLHRHPVFGLLINSDIGFLTMKDLKTHYTNLMAVFSTLEGQKFFPQLFQPLPGWEELLKNIVTIDLQEKRK